MNDIKLTIYQRNEETGRREVKRVVESNCIFVPFGIVQDLLEAVDIDKVQAILEGEATDKEAILALTPIVLSSLKEINSLLMETFEDDGLTAAEIRACNTMEIVQCILNILKYAVGIMFAKRKNK